MNAADPARDQLDLMEHVLSDAPVMAVQAVELRSGLVAGTHDARAILSPATAPLYLAACRAAGGAPVADRPLMRDDMDAVIQPMVEGVLASVAGRRAVSGAVAAVGGALLDFAGG
jgi:phenylalanine ammonia-lyase